MSRQIKSACSFPFSVQLLAKWLLATLIIAELSWVGIWTILAAHTDVARDKIYPALESTYFPDKSGARVFTYFGVFYLISGFTALFFLAIGVSFPKIPTTFLVRKYKFCGEYWTFLEISALAVFVAIQGATIWTRVELKFKPTWSADKIWYEVTKTLGKTAALTLTVLFIPISKSSFWLDLFNIHFERSIKFHRCFAWFLVIVVVVHATSAITSLVLSGHFGPCMWPSHDGCNISRWKESLELSRIITYGWTSALIALPMVVTSLPWFRRHKFEWFYYTHFLFIPSLVLLHLHFKDMVYYTAPGIAAYTLDKLIWYCSSRRPIKIISLIRPAPGFVRMIVSNESGHIFKPGQWVLVNIPSISFCQWHPMSVASAPGGTSFAIDIKVLGDWTRDLEKLSLRFDPSRPSHTCVFLDRFHGSDHSKMQGYLSHPAVLLIAGGIGITPLMSTLRALMNSTSQFPSVRNVVLVWIVKKESVINLYRQELEKMQALQRTPDGDCKLDIRVYATLSEKEDESESVSLHIHSNKRTRREEPTCCHHSPFMQHIMGYGHMLFMFVGSGGGFLLGLFIANFLFHGRKEHGPSEYQVLLQLCLAILFSGAIAGVGMSASFFRKVSTPTSERKPLLPHAETPTTSSSDEGGETGHGSTSTAEPATIVLASEEDSCSNTPRTPVGLQVALGGRPNLNEIAEDVKTWCVENDCSSVGVAVCGPNKLTDTVIQACRRVSSKSVSFVIDNETFDW